MLKLLFVLLLAVKALSLPLVRQATGPVVTISSGSYVGVSNPSTGTDVFYGLPFALPPVGSLRLQKPQPFNISYGSSVQDATTPKSNCGQQLPVDVDIPPPLSNYTGILEPSALSGSEDCLYLNLWRPSSATASSNLPVIYFIYGSGFISGGISDFDGTALITESMSLGQDIIFVTGNYRLSAWGWLPGSEMQEAGLGNLGLLDQRAALQWVQQSISQFGGDPTKVTLMGESAGALSIAIQMAMYGGDTQGLFRAAIMESGSVYPFGPMANGQDIFDQMVSATGCSDSSDPIECLRSVDSSTFYDAAQTTPDSATAYRGPAASYLPRIDGDTLTDMPQNLFNQGAFAQVPIIIGENEDEGSIWVLTSLNVTTDAGFADYITAFWPSLSSSTQESIISQYPEDPVDGCPYETGDLYALTPESKRIGSLLGDAIFIAPRRFMTQLYVEMGLPVWSYHFTHLSGTTPLGSYHGSEVAYVFGETPEYLSTQMRALWISFANTLDPNDYPGDLSLPSWSQYGTSGNQIDFGLTNNTMIVDDYRVSAMAVILDNMSDFEI